MLRPEFRKHLKETLLTAVSFARSQDREVHSSGSYFWRSSYGESLCLFGALEMMSDLPHRPGNDVVASLLGLTAPQAKSLEAGFCGWGPGDYYGPPRDEFYDLGRAIKKEI